MLLFLHEVGEFGEGEAGCVVPACAYRAEGTSPSREATSLQVSARMLNRHISSVTVLAA